MATPSSARLHRLLLLVALVALVVATVPAAVSAAVSRPVRLEAGVQRGYTFSSSGAVLTSKTVTLASPVTVTSSDRVWVTGRGAHFRIANGTFAGYLIQESMIAYTPGILVTKNYATPTRVAFPAGRYLGYKFDSAWKITTTKHYVLANPSGASISRRAMIHGRPFGEVVNGVWAGYWVPLTGPNVVTARSFQCQSPGHVAAGTQQVLKVLPGAANQVALTFDMGGRLDPGLDIVNRLLLDRVCTTFFPTGAMTNTTFGKQIVQTIGRHPYLFELGNHTQHHCNLRDGGGGSPTTAPCPTTRPTTAFMVKELKDAETVLRSVSGMNPAPYWRPPYGAYDSGVLAAATQAGYTKTFLWDVDTIDWRPVSQGGPTAGSIAVKVATNAVNGSDVLMHLGGFNTYDALPYMVMRLRERGLQPTTISDILR
jgi:peptidoglycan/xylan/chitin deacetylase (PgdA/CDA1 family)